MSSNIFHQPGLQSLATLPEGVSDFLTLKTSREIQRQRLQAKLDDCSDWRVAKQIQERIDRLNST